MADIFTKKKRSEVMSRILGRGNKKTELALLRLLRKLRITGWRRHVRMKGNPDFVFRKKQVVVFVDGCFWHGCPRHGHFPRTNRAFWTKKIRRNRERDKRTSAALREKGWTVLRIWEHELARKNEAKLERRIRAVF